MADNIQEQNQQQNSNEQPGGLSAEIKAQMEQSLAIGVPPGSAQQNQQQEQGGNNSPGANDNPPPPVTFEILKEKFGYESPELAIKEIEELRTFKATPPKPQAEPLKFENEFSERLFKAIQSGKIKEVQKSLYEQSQLDSLTTIEVNKENAAEIIKFGLALKHKDLEPDEIEFEYNKQYGIPKEPLKKAGEDDLDFDERTNEWKEKVKFIEMSKVIAAKMMKPELEAAKSKVVFPELSQQVEPEYLQWKQSLQQQQAQNEEIVQSYNGVTAESVGFKLNFIDEKNKVDFNIDYKPDDNQFKQALEVVQNFQKFFDHFKKPDGTPDREGFLQGIIFAMNRKEIAMEFANQSKNGTIKSKLPDNSSGGLVRQIAGHEGEKNEVDEMMKLALGPWQKVAK